MLRYCYDDTFGKQFMNEKNKTNDGSSKTEIFVILDNSWMIVKGIKPLRCGQKLVPPTLL
jgi:hypothetical protein